MPPRRWIIFATLIASSLPAGAQSDPPPAKNSFVTMGLFWTFCGARHSSPPDSRWCFGYILGHIDATIAIGTALHRAPLCLTADNPISVVERIITYMPASRGQESAGTYVQAAVVRALRCD